MAGFTMRTVLMSIVLVGALLTAPATASAQTPAMQGELEIRLELQRLRQGELVRLVNGQSLRVLAPPVRDAARDYLADAAGWLRRVLSRPGR